MGLTYYAADAKFFLPKERKEATRQRLGEATDGSAAQALSASLRELLRLWGFELIEDNEENIVALYPSSERLREDEYYKKFFNLLAPDVREGSFLIYYGLEDGVLWGWRFKRNPATGQVEAEVGEVYGVFESDLTSEQTKYYVDNFDDEGGSDGNA